MPAKVLADSCVGQLSNSAAGFPACLTTQFLSPCLTICNCLTICFLLSHYFLWVGSTHDQAKMNLIFISIYGIIMLRYIRHLALAWCTSLESSLVFWEVFCWLLCLCGTTVNYIPKLKHQIKQKNIFNALNYVWREKITQNLTIASRRDKIKINKKGQKHACQFFY